MNLYSLTAVIEALQRTAADIQKQTENVKNEQGEISYPYAFGRLSGSTKPIQYQASVLAEQLPTLEALRDVISMFRLDDPAVVRRIQAMSRTRQNMLEEELVELLELNDLLEDPEPETNDEDEEEN